ncbi:MAG: NAD(P)H-hydrate epimerase [bacterium]
MKDNYLSVEAIRNIDKHFIENIGIPGVVLMEQAGISVAKHSLDLLRLKGLKNVYIFCGGGNNGGDGFVAARHIMSNGYKCRIFLFKPADELKGDALINFRIARNIGAKFFYFNDFQIPTKSIIQDRGLIIDSLLGTGTKGKLKPNLVKLIEYINNLKFPVLSVDIPSGLNGDKGIEQNSCIKANTTVTIYAKKKSFKLSEVKEYTGKIFVARIGFSKNN